MSSKKKILGFIRPEIGIWAHYVVLEAIILALLHFARVWQFDWRSWPLYIALFFVIALADQLIHIVPFFGD